MKSQITLLTWAERTVRAVVAPSGMPRLSVTIRRTRWTPFSSVRAVRRTAARLRGATSMAFGPSMVSRSSPASSATVTGWSRRLATVALNGPLELARVTAWGALT